MQLREPPLVQLVLVQQMQHLQGIHTYGKKRRDPNFSIREGDLGLGREGGAALFTGGYCRAGTLY